MVHDRREYWERTLEDGFELTYQVYVALGLRCGAALAGPLGAKDRVQRWNRASDRIVRATFSHPTLALVEDGRLLKRRSVSGEPVRYVRAPAAVPDTPMATEQVHFAEPDASVALAIALEFRRCRFAACARYAGRVGRPLERAMVWWRLREISLERRAGRARPLALCYLLYLAGRSTMPGCLIVAGERWEWLNTVQGGRTGAWFEEIPIIRSQAPHAGILPWNSGRSQPLRCPSPAWCPL